MTTTTPKLLITRPQEQACHDSDYFARNDLACVICPMMSVTDLPFSLPDWEEYDALIFTSANGVEAYAKMVAERTTDVFCVGKQTAQCARDYGFVHIEMGEGTAVSLLDMIKDDAVLSAQRYLYLRGKDISVDVQDELQKAGVGCLSRIVYEARLSDSLCKDAVEAFKNNEIAAVSFLSCRAAENFIRLVRAANLEGALKSTKALCLSDSVLECVRVFEWASTHVSPVPDGQVFKEFCLKIMHQAE